MMIKTSSLHPLAAASAGLLLFASASNAALLAFDALNYVRLQAAGPNNIIEVDDFQIGQTAFDVGAVPEPSSTTLPGDLSLLVMLRRRRD